MAVTYKDRTIYVSKALSEDGRNFVEVRYDRYDEKFYFVDATGTFKDLTGASYKPSEITEPVPPTPVTAGILTPDNLSNAGTLTNFMGYSAFPDGPAEEIYWFQYATDVLESLDYTIEDQAQIGTVAIPLFLAGSPDTDIEDDYTLTLDIYETTVNFIGENVQSDLTNLSNPIVSLTKTRNQLTDYIKTFTSFNGQVDMLFKVFALNEPISYTGELILKFTISGHSNSLDLGVHGFKQNPPEPDPYAALDQQEAYLGANTGFFVDGTLGLILFDVELS